jgi:hypothetical protein
MYEYTTEITAPPIAEPNNIHMVAKGKAAEPVIKMPEIMKRVPPKRWVFSQTISLDNVHGVRIPIKKLRLAFLTNHPTTMKRIPKAGAIITFIWNLNPKFQAIVRE